MAPRHASALRRTQHLSTDVLVTIVKQMMMHHRRVVVATRVHVKTIVRPRMHRHRDVRDRRNGSAAESSATRTMTRRRQDGVKHQVRALLKPSSRVATTAMRRLFDAAETERHVTLQATAVSARTLRAKMRRRLESAERQLLLLLVQRMAVMTPMYRRHDVVLQTQAREQRPRRQCEH